MSPGTAAHAIRARRVRFDWKSTPLHWIPGDPKTTHFVNVLHLLLPAGEKWFVDVYREALPLVTDERLREEVRGFMGQEAVHSRAHAAVLDHLREHGLETGAYTRRIDWFFEELLGAGWWPRILQRYRLRLQLATIAAIEHFTCVLGNWVILDSRALDEVASDPVMLDLLRWHGAEEVEHRAVAFDVHQHLGGRARYPRRVAAMLLVAPCMAGLWIIGVRFLLAQDPTVDDKRYRWRDYRRAVRQGRAPGWEIVRAIPRYMRPSHHPSQEGSLQPALDYLSRSPAARGYAAGGG